MFRQTDPKLAFKADSDCYLFCILRILEKARGFEYTRSQVAQFRKVAVRAEFIGDDGYINARGISGIAVVSSGLTKHHVYAKRVESTESFNYVIAKFRREVSSGKYTHHFVLMNTQDPTIVDFDPWSVTGARTTKEGKIIDYRYVYAEKV